MNEKIEINFIFKNDTLVINKKTTGNLSKNYKAFVNYIDDAINDILEKEKAKVEGISKNKKVDSLYNEIKDKKFVDVLKYLDENEIDLDDFI